MKSVVLVPLQTINIDFRDLLPNLDRGRFKHPFIPADIWNSLGNKVNYTMWDRLLRKHRGRIVTGPYPYPELEAVFLEDSFRIQIMISDIDNWDVSDLKYEIIQTMMHELIHVNQQYANELQYERPVANVTSDDADELYLSCFGEVQAYAHCQAIDILSGKSNNLNRYDYCLPKVKHELYRQRFRWIQKYSS
jgi:hypothetical protein